MIIDRISRIFGTGRFNSLLLEIFAIFLGISASFAVEEWRQGRQDQATFEHYLEGIYYDAAREAAVNSRMVYQNHQVIGALDILLGGAADTLVDGDLVALTEVLFTPWTHARGDSSYRALMSADLSMPLDDTLQRLNELYGVRELYSDIRQRLITVHNDALAQTMSDRGAVLNPGVLHWDSGERSLTIAPRLELKPYAGVANLLEQGVGVRFGLDSADRARRSLEDPEGRLVLAQMLHRTLRASDNAVAIIGIDEAIMSTVRERLPDFTLPVESLGVLGTATPGGWAIPRAIPLEPEGGDWWSAEMSLVDGMAKFIANDNYGLSWGVEPAWEVIDPLADPTHYVGDPDAVFPAGTGVLDGQNIPVRAGRYRVRFNTRTFEYEFRAAGKAE